MDNLMNKIKCGFYRKKVKEKKTSIDAKYSTLLFCYFVGETRSHFVPSNL